MTFWGFMYRLIRFTVMVGVVACVMVVAAGVYAWRYTTGRS